MKTKVITSSQNVVSNLLRYSNLFILLAIVSSCITMKDSFQPVSNKPAGKSVVYIYWPTQKSVTTSFTIRANGSKVGSLKDGGYLVYFAEPGELDLSANVQLKLFTTALLDMAVNQKEKLTINIEEGNEYYVSCNGFNSKFQVSHSDGQRLHMELTSNSDQIKNCKFIKTDS